VATSPHVQTPEDFSPAAEYTSPWLDRAIAPREEALSLFALVGRNGDTVESVRELIAVPHSIETALLLYAQRNPEDALGIERVLHFRRRVAEEFERLARENRVGSPNVLVNSRSREPQEIFGGPIA
jgi:hypothetical protein